MNSPTNSPERTRIDGGTPAARPVDARGPRFNQGVLAVALLAGYVFDARWVIPAWGAVLLLSAVGGSTLGPFLRLWRDVIGPRMGPASELEDSRPPRFAAAVGTVFLAAGTVALAAGVPGLAWGLAMVVAVLAAVAAFSGLCVGCELYVWYRRRTAAGWDAVA